MPLIDELNERRENALAEIEGCKKQLAEVESELAGLRDAVSDLDRAIAALEPAPVAEPETQTGEGVEIPEGFTKWEGGECPAPVGTRVEVIYRNHFGSDPWPFEVYSEETTETWTHDGTGSDIIAYRIIEASSPSEPAHDQAEIVAATSPGEVEESRDQSDDEAQRAAAIELTADVEPEIDAKAAIDAMVDDMVGKLNLSPDAVGTQTYMDGDQLVIREITADEYFAPEPIPQPEWNAPQPTEGYAPVTNPEADFWARGLTEKPKPERKHNPFSIFGIKRETEEVG